MDEVFVVVYGVTNTAITEEQREKRTSRFLKDKGKNHPNVTVSQDGSRTVQIPASAGKKRVNGKDPEQTGLAHQIQKGDF